MKDKNDRIQELILTKEQKSSPSDLSTSPSPRWILLVFWLIQAVLLFLFFPQLDQPRDFNRFFSIGTLSIHYYGLILAGAVCISIFLLAPLVKRRFDDGALLDRLLVWILPCAFIGARLYYVLFSWDLYASDWPSIFKLWEGGLAIHGGLIGGLIGIAIALRIEKQKRKSVSIIALLDLLAPVIAIGQSFGRWGNFINQEAFGTPSNLPWKMYIDPSFRPPLYSQEAFFHPTFLYESLGMLILFTVLWLMISRRSWHGLISSRPGVSLGVYLIGYGLLRFFIEGFRIDSLMVGPLRVAQLVSGVFVLIGVVLLIRSRSRTASSL